MSVLKWMALALALPCATALATPLTQIRADATYDVNADATFTAEFDDVVRVEDPQAIRGAGQRSISYSDSLEKLEILEAYTTTRDGTRIDVTPDKILDQSARASSRAPMFSDRKIKTIIFPQVEVGSTLTVRYRRTQLKPQIPGVFSMWETANRNLDSEGGDVTLRAPSSLTLHIDVRDAQGGETEGVASGGREWHWKFATSKGQPGELRQVNNRDVVPYVMASTLATYGDFAKAYDARAAAMAAPTAAVKKLADEITAGIRDKRMQARALYEWVSLNIRYVAITLEYGGLVPHDADAILAARYGDCKDHVTLLAALLAARKIRSSTVLINAGDSYRVADTVMPGTFNHVITYLPDFDLYVDSTAGVLPFGTLAPPEYGKQGLIVDSGHGKPEMRTLPLADPARDWIDAKLDLKIGEDGTLTGTSSGESSGYLQAIDRQIFREIPQDQRSALATKLMGAQGKATVHAGDPLDLAKPFVYSIDFEMPQYFKLPGPAAKPVPASLGRFGGSMREFVQLLAQPTRTLPIICPSPGRRGAITRLEIPATMKVTSVPKDVSVEGKLGKYEAKYALEGSTLTATRTLTLKYPGAVCSVDDYAELRNLALAMREDESAQMIYQ